MSEITTKAGWRLFTLVNSEPPLGQLLPEAIIAIEAEAGELAIQRAYGSSADARWQRDMDIVSANVAEAVALERSRITRWLHAQATKPTLVVGIDEVLAVVNARDKLL